LAAGALLLADPDDPEDPEEEPVEAVELSDFAGVFDEPESALASEDFFSAGLSVAALAGRLSVL